MTVEENFEKLYINPWHNITKHGVAQWKENRRIKSLNKEMKLLKRNNFSTW